MGELAAVRGAPGATAAATPTAGSSGGGPATGRGPPPGPAPPPAPAVATAAPASIAVTRAGLALEAVAWLRPGAGAGDAVGLRGPALVLPLAPGSEPAHPSAPSSTAAVARLAGPLLATVLGPAGPDATLAEAEGLLVLLRGARLHLPAGARLEISWRATPEPIDRPPLAAGPQPAAAGAVPVPADTAPIEPGGASAREAEPDTAGPGKGPPAGERPEAAALGPAPAPVPSDLANQALRGLARSLGLAVAPDPEEDGQGGGRRRGGEGEPEDAGRSALLVDFPALGRLRLELAWSPATVELRIHGLPALPGADRAALLRAFEDALAAAGARGRAVLLGPLRAGAPPAP